MYLRISACFWWRKLTSVSHVDELAANGLERARNGRNIKGYAIGNVRVFAGAPSMGLHEECSQTLMLLLPLSLFVLRWID